MKAIFVVFAMFVSLSTTACLRSSPIVTINGKSHATREPTSVGEKATSAPLAIGACKFRFTEKYPPKILADDRSGHLYKMLINNPPPSIAVSLNCVHPLSEQSPDILGKLAGIMKSGNSWVIDTDTIPLVDDAKFYPLQGNSWDGGATSGGTEKNHDRFLNFCLISHDSALCGSVNESENSSAFNNEQKLRYSVFKTFTSIEFLTNP